MPTSNHFLTPNPPTLFSPPKKQIISGSTNSFSSSSSSNSRSASYFGQWSHTSSASAYLTDLTPPISPSNSHLRVDSKDEDLNRVSSDHSDIHWDARTDYEAVSPDDGCADIPLLAEGGDNDLGSAGEVYEEREYFDEANFSADFDRAMGLIYQEAMNGTYIDTYDADSGIEHPLLVPAPAPAAIPASQHDFLSPQSPLQMPAKPIIQAVEVETDCSPLTLCDDPSFESSSSLSQSLLSPIHIDANVSPSSPAIYDDYLGHEQSPLPSTHRPILTSAFSSRGQRRSFPVVELTGENLDTALLIRLEVAASNNAAHSGHQNRPPTGLGFYMPPQSHPPPSPLISYPSLRFLENYLDQSPLRGSFVVSSPLADSAQGQNHPSVGSGERQQVGRSIPTASSCPAVQDQPLVGLGLGALAEGCLQSSASISKLDTVPHPVFASEANICESNILLDDQQSSPCVRLAGSSLRYEIEPSGALSTLESLPSPLTSEKYSFAQIIMSDTAYLGSVEENFSCNVENLSSDNIGSGIETNVLPASLSLADILQSSVTSARRCSTELHKRFSCGQGHFEGNVSCGMPLASQCSSFTSEHATNLSDTVPITLDSTHPRFAFALAESHQGMEPSATRALALWADETPRQNLEHSSLIFQDSPLHRLAEVIRSDDYIARFNMNLANQAPNFPPLGQGPSSLTAPLRSDPRSPCSPSLEYFHPESYIFGCLGVVPTTQRTSAWSSPLSSSFSIRDSATFPSSSDLRGESQGVEGLGLGLPSDLTFRSLRERDMSVVRHSALGGLGGISTTQECQNIAQLASLSSPNGGTSRTADTSPRLVFKVPKFVQRRLYVIPEQPTPSPTFSAVRPRTPSPLAQPSSSRRLGVSIFKRLRLSARSGEGAPHNEGDLVPSPRDGELCQPAEDLPTPPAKTAKNLLRRCLRAMSRISRRAASLHPEDAGSPGVIEHVDVPQGLGIFGRRGRGRLEPTTRKFQVLF